MDLWEGGYRRNLRSGDGVVQADTAFCVGPVATVFTAIAVMQPREVVVFTSTSEGNGAPLVASSFVISTARSVEFNTKRTIDLREVRITLPLVLLERDKRPSDCDLRKLLSSCCNVRTPVGGIPCALTRLWANVPPHSLSHMS